MDGPALRRGVLPVGEQPFGTDPERYDRTRPGYPEALMERIVASSPGRAVLDVGCGTGIAARQLQGYGCRVLGVAPDARMAEYARGRGGEVEVATFEDWEPAGLAFDVIIAATAWHWVDPVAGAAKAARVLRPGGRLAVFWHAAQLPSEVAGAFADVYERVVPDSPFDVNAARQPLDAYEVMCTTAVDGVRQVGAFGDPERWRFDWERTYTRDAWLDQMCTQGTLTRLSPGQQHEVLRCVGSAIDTLGGSFTMPYATVAASAART